jgi:hypothetical protein
MTIRAYIATEGPHDVAFLAELLRPWGFKRLRNLPDVEAYWQPLIPRTFPHEDDLLKRVPVPTFFSADGRTLALDAASGIDNLHNRVEENLTLLHDRPAVAVVLDADANKSAADRFDELARKLRKLALPVPDVAGIVSPELPPCGIFVLPDNVSAGTLETLLEECARENYAGLLGEASAYVDRIESVGLTSEDLKDFQKPTGRSKAIISAVGAILRPGKAIQVSLQDNRWLRDRALELPRVRAVRDFLAKILEITVPSFEASPHTASPPQRVPSRTPWSRSPYGSRFCSRPGADRGGRPRRAA